jgi:hypothetical protein
MIYPDKTDRFGNRIDIINIYNRKYTDCPMTRIYHAILCAAVIILVITAGCTSNTSGASPLVPGTTIPAVTPSSAATAAAVTTTPGTAGTQAPGTCTANINSDAANCGGCGYACPANALCQQGQCYCKEGYAVKNNQCEIIPNEDTITGNGCPAGMNPCPDGYCYELSSSAANCGICGNMCPGGMICSASTCSNVPTETTTAVPATTTATTTTATTTTTSSVSFGPTLVGGLSKACFLSGGTTCGGTCVNLSTNNGNCGSCGNICSGLTATCCGGGCTNLNKDTSNCGTCGHKCSVGSTCESGSCKVKVGVFVTGKALVTSKISLQITPLEVQPGYKLPGY